VAQPVGPPVDDLEPLSTPSVVDVVYGTLRRRIASGALAPGLRLHQADLAQRLGTSRTPVREALARLTADRLVEFHANRGFFVATMSGERTRAAVEARRLLEPMMARLAAERRPAAALARMSAAIEAERRASDPWDAYEASREFHLALAEASANEFLERLADQLWAADLGRPLYQAYVNLSGSEWIGGDAKQHDRIRRAILAGDPAAAEHAVKQHLETARTYMQSVMVRDDRDTELPAG
jgi:DNA-binding GntR family transcriptional regulator